MRGTKSKSFHEIYESIESIGASLHLSAAKHSVSFFGKGLVDDLGLLLELLADVLQRPAFPKVHVERLKGQMLTGIALRDQDTGSMAQLTFNQLAYPGHPYSIPSSGFAQSIAGINVQDLKDFHQKWMGPKGMVLAVVGALPAKKAADAVQAALGAWQQPTQAEPSALPIIEPPQGLIEKEVFIPGKSQCDIVLGTHGPSRYEKDYLAAALGNNILGRFGMYGRIGERVREAEGLAYYAYSSISGGPGPGAWEVIAGVNPANRQRAVDLIRAEIRRFVGSKVKPEELLENKTNFVGRLPLQLEANEGVARALVHLERYRLGLDYYQRYPELISNISREEVLAATRRYLDPDNLVVAIAGPVGEGA
jgi:zinc protease